MTEQTLLPRFRKPPVSEVAIGAPFQAPMLTPVHLGLYYSRVKARFPTVTVQPPLAPVFEMFGATPAVSFPFPTNLPFPANLPFPVAVSGTVAPIQPRIWFTSQDGSSLIQLQSGRIIFNWRAGLQQNTYPHFHSVQTEFMAALDELEALTTSEGLGSVIANVNQCEVVYVNPLPVSETGVSLSEPQKIFRVWSDACGEEWREAPEDVSFSLRYRFNDQSGNPFGRLIVALSSGIAQNGSPAFNLELTGRGHPTGTGRAAIADFHEDAHQAIVRCFAAMTTPEMHSRWERYQ